MPEIIHDRVKQVMSDTFQLPLDAVPDDADPQNLPQWDSLGHMSLMLALEAEFEVEISSETILELVSLEEIVAFLESSGVGRGVD